MLIGNADKVRQGGGKIIITIRIWVCLGMTVAIMASTCLPDSSLCQKPKQVRAFYCLKHEHKSRIVVASSRTSRWVSLIIHIMSAMRAQLPWKRYQADVCESVCRSTDCVMMPLLVSCVYVPWGNTAMKPRRGIASRSVNAPCTTTSFINICQGADHLGWSVAESAIPICLVHTWERCSVRTRC